MAVAFTEMAGSPRISIGPRGFSAIREFKIAWADWNEFSAELIGGWLTAGGQHHLLEPKGFPGVPGVFIESIDIKPFDRRSPDGDGEVTAIESGLNEYTSAGALVTAKYGSEIPKNNEDEDAPVIPDGTHLDYEATLTSEIMSIPSSSWYWDGPNGGALVGGGNPSAVETPTNPGIKIPMTVHYFTWSRIAKPPWDAIRAARGTVNHFHFFGAHPETVLFIGAIVRRQFQFLRQDEGNFWTVKYEFHERTLGRVARATGTGQTRREGNSSDPDGGWNHMWRPAGSNKADSGRAHWEKVISRGHHTTKEDGRTMYGTYDFAELFKHGA